MRPFTLMVLLLALQSAVHGATPVRLTLPGVEPNERIELQIQVPEGHRAGSPARYLWVLDGESAFATAAEAVRLVAMECDAPPPVLVALGDGHAIGAPGNRRSRDYTPVPSDTAWARGEGGSARWLAALRERALPAVEARVGPALERTLYGHSYGGLAVATAWLESPDLFQRWVLASPALYYGQDWAYRQLAAMPAAAASAGASMLLLAGSEEAWAVDGNARWAEQLGQRPAAGRPALQSFTLAGFGHLSGSPVSLMRAVRWAYCAR